MYLASTSQYDIDGNLIASVAYSGLDASGNPITAPPTSTGYTTSSTNVSYSTYYQYDWRDRQIGSVGPDGVATMYLLPDSSTESLDNLGQATETRMYAGASGSPDSISLGTPKLRSDVVTSFDSQGRVYLSQTFNVDPTSGMEGDYLPTNTWYDSRGNVVATQTGSGPINKSQYNSAGQLAASCTCADANPQLSNYAWMTSLQTASGSTVGDTVVEQTQIWYDANGDTIATADYKRLPADTTATGPLNATNSYVTATASFYDQAGRDIEDVNYGRVDVLNASAATALFNADGSLVDAVDAKGNTKPDEIPDAAEGTPPLRQTTLPNTYLVAATVFNDTFPTGPIVDTINNAGVVTETRSDLMGRTIRTIQNFDGLAYGAAGTPGSGFDAGGNVGASLANESQDVTTDSLYDASSRLVATVAYDVKGAGTAVVTPEITAYAHESAIDPSLQTGEIAPDSTDSPAASAVSSLSQSGGTATAQTTAAQNYLPGDWVLIQGASDARYNGWFQVLSATATTFTYTVPLATPPSGGSGSTVQALLGWKSLGNGSMTWNSADTATIAVPNDFAPGDWVSIQGANQPEFNGAFCVTSANASSFSFDLSGASVSTATGTIRFRRATDETATVYDVMDRSVTARDQNDLSLPAAQQRGVTHTYTYGLPGSGSSTGKLVFDSARIPSTSTGVDTKVLSIGTTYDDIGRVQTVTSYSTTNGTGTPVNQIQDAYDGWGGLIQQWQATAGPVNTSTTPSIQYGYNDGAGTAGVAAYLRLQQVTYPNSGTARTVNYNYATGVDAIMSRLSSIMESGGTTDASYSYLGANQIVKEDYVQAGVNLNYDPAGNDSFNGLDRFGRVLQQTWSQDGSSSNVLDQYNYTYNNAGDRLTRTNALDSVLSESYQYDAVDRLTQWSVNGASQETWYLDSLGNDLNTGSYGLSNEETPKSGSSGYDLAGNMTTLSSGTTAIYDAWNRLVEVTSGSNVLEECQYDGAGRRVQVLTNFSGQVAGTVTADYYSGQQLIQSSITGSSVASYQYVWSPRYIDAPILRDTLNSSGTIITGLRVFYLGDANYNVTALVSSSGQVLERYAYTPYGKVTYYNAAWGQVGSSANNNTILYTGRGFDSAIGLYYYRARYYDPAQQRFVSQDPLGYRAHDPNLYRYCTNRPTCATDPRGTSIYLTQGQATGHGVVGVVHCDIAVDTWEIDVATDVIMRMGLASFSFGVVSNKRIFWPGSPTWLGWSTNGPSLVSAKIPGWNCEGEIYRSFSGFRKIQSTLRTTPLEDMEFFTYMERRVGQRDRYSLILDCVNYVNHEYEAAGKHFGFKM